MSELEIKLVGIVRVNYGVRFGSKLVAVNFSRAIISHGLLDVARVDTVNLPDKSIRWMLVRVSSTKFVLLVITI